MINNSTQFLIGHEVDLIPFRFNDGQVVDPIDMVVAREVSESFSRKHGLIVFQKLQNYIHVAMVNFEEQFEEYLTGMSFGKVIYHKISPLHLEYAQDRIYGLPENLPDKMLGGILLLNGDITASQLVDSLRLQPEYGGRIGAVLTSNDSVTHWDIASAVSKQVDLPLIELMANGQVSSVMLSSENSLLWTAMSERFWFQHLTVPITMNEDSIAIAMVDPLDVEAVLEIENQFQRKVRVFITGYRDVMYLLKSRYRSDYEQKSRLQLLENNPEESAHRPLSTRQKYSMSIGLVITVLALIWNWMIVGTIIMGAIQLFYAFSNVFRLWMTLKATKVLSLTEVNEEEIDQINLHSLPIYTILVPLYKEASVIPILTNALKRLRYPKDRLDVKFLLEEDDVETIQAAKDYNLPKFIELVIVPPSEPRTKPKACNYGLQTARGEYVVIFDAEDIPESDQLLKAIATFRRSPDSLACVQAKLNYYNTRQNVLTRWFTSEYTMWFDLFLPALFSSNMPVPLGGTSNHFKTSVLMDLGAWDPFNVTEDADLGVRLYKHGYTTGIIDSTTYEEANSDFVNWIRQRSRWVKGYIQTWLVHMRHPVKLYKDLGFVGFMGFQMMVGGTPFIFIFNPVLWALALSWYIFGPNFEASLLPPQIYYLAGINWIMGNFIFIYINLIGLARREIWSLVLFAVLSPIYWLYMSIAAWKGLFQLITKPSYWEKTIHGLSSVPHEFVNAGEENISL